VEHLEGQGGAFIFSGAFILHHSLLQVRLHAQGLLQPTSEAGQALLQVSARPVLLRHARAIHAVAERMRVVGA
jgi:hypothetical protein